MADTMGHNKTGHIGTYAYSPHKGKGLNVTPRAALNVFCSLAVLACGIIYLKHEKKVADGLKDLKSVAENYSPHLDLNQKGIHRELGRIAHMMAKLDLDENDASALLSMAKTTVQTNLAQMEHDIAKRDISDEDKERLMRIAAEASENMDEHIFQTLDRLMHTMAEFKLNTGDICSLFNMTKRLNETPEFKGGHEIDVFRTIDTIRNNVWAIRLKDSKDEDISGPYSEAWKAEKTEEGKLRIARVESLMLEANNSLDDNLKKKLGGKPIEEEDQSHP